MKIGKGLLGCAVLVLVLVIAVAYIALGVLDLDPRKQTYEVTISMDQTSGLMDTSLVALHGMKIGNVQQINTQRDSVQVRVAIDSSRQIPADSTVIVQNLSAAGEQYLDFRPQHSGGPYLRDGASIGSQQVSDSPTVGTVLAKVDRVGQLLDPGVVAEMGELLTTMTDDEAVLSDAAATLELVRGTVRDKGHLIRRMFRLVQELDKRFMTMGGPALLRPVAATLDRLAPAMGEVLTEVNNFAIMSKSTNVWNGVIGPFMDGLLQRLGVLLPEFGGIAGALLPVTGQLRGIRVNMNAFTDLWGRAFPKGGPMRVQVTVR